MPPETLVDEGDWEDGYGYIFRPAQFYKTVRAALARWGRPVPPPAEGDVAELVEELRGLAEYFSGEMYSSEWIDQLNRAAALLERQAAPVPVAVSERLPEAEDCDAEGRCWFYDPCDHGWWCLRSALFIDDDPDPLTHWLPAHALPLPSGGGATNG